MAGRRNLASFYSAPAKVLDTEKYPALLFLLNVKGRTRTAIAADAITVHSAKKAEPLISG